MMRSCPNCGEIHDEFTGPCPMCGHFSEDRVGSRFAAHDPLRGPGELKVHTCANCACRYGYGIQLPKVFSGLTGERARLAYDRFVGRFVERHPCPECGLVQPAMFADRRATLHGRMIGVSLLLFAVVLGATFLQAGTISEFGWLPIAHWIAIVVGVVVVFFQRRIGSWTPNDDLGGNQMIAQQEVGAGAVVVVEASPQKALNFDRDWENTTRAPSFPIIIGAIGLIALVSIEVVRLAAGWKHNSGCWPTIVGIGDSAQIDFPKGIRTLDDQWRGKVSATVRNAKQLGLPSSRLTATTKQGQWPARIWEDEDDKTPTTVYIDVIIPNRRDLEGKALDLNLQADVEFPAPDGAGQWQLERRRLTRAMTLHIGSRGAGVVCGVLTIGGLSAAFLLTVLSGIQLHRFSKGLKKRDGAVEVVNRETL